jgi:hypothetical protein
LSITSLPPTLPLLAAEPVEPDPVDELVDPAPDDPLEEPFEDPFEDPPQAATSTHTVASEMSQLMRFTVTLRPPERSQMVVSFGKLLNKWTITRLQL